MTSGPPGYSFSTSGQDLIANERHSTPFPTRYVELARQTLADAWVAALNNSRLLLIVDSALAALHLLFTAALGHPAEWELDEFFEDFVRRCVIDLDALEPR